MSTVGPELVQVAVVTMIIDGIKSKLSEQATSWAPVDKALSLKMGTPYRETNLVEPKLTSIVTGDRPSILDKPWEFFPSINVTAWDATTTPEGRRIDYGTALMVPFYVEAIVPSDRFNGKDVDERFYQQGLVDRRTKRMGDAIAQVLLSDRSLGFAPEEDLNIRVRQTPPFEIDGNRSDNRGRSCIFSLVRVDAQVDVYAALPGVETVSTLLPVGVGLGT